MGSSVPVRCPACLRDHAFVPPVFPCACGAPLAPPLLRDAAPQPITRRTWTDSWVTVRCPSCGRQDQWPQPELGCGCGTVLRIPVRPVPAAGTDGPAETVRPAGEREHPGTAGDPATPPARDPSVHGPAAQGPPAQGPPAPEVPAHGPAAWTPAAQAPPSHGPAAADGPDHGRDDTRPALPGAEPAPVPPPAGALPPGPPTVPDAHGATPARTRPPFRPLAIRSARDAVTAAALYLKWLGFRDILQSPEHPASGIDLRAPGLVAQVDPRTEPSTLRDVETLWLHGLNSSALSVFFSLAGYAQDTRARADSLGVPLFVIDRTGTPQPANTSADSLVLSGA
ncbi:hypothetical protein ACFYVL_15160 [Streptomyces sp. NPDC004111]|uniref:hypothetical protein n=1 Tax=Streptomyces sp. NPDC004111 TaxID=3364690 RepID=UPI0036ABC1C3